MKPAPLILADSWTYKVTVLSDMVARRVARIVSEISGLNLSQWRVMIAVADQAGRTVSDVVTVTPMDKTIVSRSAQHLVKIGLLTRTASALDGRVSHLNLTETGQNLYNEIMQKLDFHDANGKDLMGSNEETELLNLLDQTIDLYRSKSHKLSQG